MVLGTIAWWGGLLLLLLSKGKTIYKTAWRLTRRLKDELIGVT